MPLAKQLTTRTKKNRCQQLIALAEQIQPNLIVTETFPFGRRQMRFELLPLLEWAQNQPKPPVLVSSIRDILQQRPDKRIKECLEIVQQYYQKVLVHGDPEFVPLEHSFDQAAALADKLHYSGYVCPSAPVPQQRQALITVSIGGGSAGFALLDAALALYQSGYASDCQWLLICGPNMPEQRFNHYRQYAKDRLQVVRLADDFIATLGRSRVSLSLAGYNTVMDLLVAQVPSVVVPFEGKEETEQLSRALLLEKSQVLSLVREQELSADSLRQGIESVLGRKLQRPAIETKGAEHSAQLLSLWAKEHRQNG